MRPFIFSINPPTRVCSPYLGFREQEYDLRLNLDIRAAIRFVCIPVCDQRRVHGAIAHFENPTEAAAQRNSPFIPAARFMIIRHYRSGFEIPALSTGLKAD